MIMDKETKGMLEQACARAIVLKEKILNFEIKRWIDLPTYMRIPYRKEIYNILREAGWYICDAEEHVYTISDMNKHMERAQQIIRENDKNIRK